MANSSWTAEHIRQLFLAWAPPALVYPPCDTADLAALPLERKLKRLYLVSLAQVRGNGCQSYIQLHGPFHLCGSRYLAMCRCCVGGTTCSTSKKAGRTTNEMVYMHHRCRQADVLMNEFLL